MLKILEQDYVLYSIFDFLDKNFQQWIILIQISKVLRQILMKHIFHKLPHFVFRENTSITHDVLNFINRFPGLKYLDVSYTDIQDDGLKEISKLTYLKQLHLLICKHLTNNGLIYLWDLTNLEKLSLDTYDNDNPHQTKDDELIYLVNLTKLNKLKYTTISTGFGLRYLTNLTNLTHLNLNCYKFTKQGFSLLSKLPSLNTLEITDLDDSTINFTEPISNIKTLENLKISYISIQDLSLTYLTNIKTLILNNCSSFTKLPSELQKLKELQLINKRYTIEPISGLQYLNQLEKLIIKGYDPSDIHHIFNMKNLEYLEILNNTTYDLNLNYISCLTNLKYFIMETKLNYRGPKLNILNLSPLTKLDTININSNYILDLSDLKLLTWIKNIYLSLFTDIIAPELTDNDLNKIYGLKIRELEIINCSKITDTGIKNLLNNNLELKLLKIYRCCLLTENILPHIKQLSSLNTLHLHHLNELTPNWYTYLTKLRHLTDLRYPNSFNTHLENITRLFPSTEVSMMF